MTNVSSNADIRDFNWHDTNDTAEVEIRIVAPQTEPPGIKQANVTFEAWI